MQVSWTGALLAGVIWGGSGCTTFPSGAVTRPAGPTPNESEAGEPALDEEQPALDEAVSETDAPSSEGESQAAEPTAPEPTGPTVASVCESLCRMADQQCDKAAARRCRGQCVKYVEKSKGCEAEYRTALECQAAEVEKKELCGNVAAARCVDQFKDIKRCERGEPAPVAAPTEKLPEGWARITDNKLHFTVALPRGAALVPDAKLRTWRYVDGNVEYLAAQLPTPGKPITSAVLLKLVVDYVGYRCQKNLRLHGQFEIKDEVAILFDSACNDGTEWHGMLRARPDQALATASHAPAGSRAVTEDFYYSYKRLTSAR